MVFRSLIVTFGIINLMHKTTIIAGPSTCWSDNTIIACSDDCQAYLDLVNNEGGTYTMDDVCCTYAENGGGDTTIAHAGCIICNSAGGNSYCASGSPYDCFTECVLDDCNNPDLLQNASGTDTCNGGDDDDDDENDDDDVCFSADDTVELEGGIMKRLADLSVGDRVLSADRAGVLSYSDVVFKPHGADGKPTSFLKVTTDSGKALKATPSHLLQRCDGYLVYTKDLRTGDCLATKDGEENVRSVEPSASKALPYSAVVLNEYLVVGGVIASPFALNHGAANMYYAAHRTLYRMGFGSALASSNAMAANAMVGSTAISALNLYTGLNNKYLKYAGLKSL